MLYAQIHIPQWDSKQRQNLDQLSACIGLQPGSTYNSGPARCHPCWTPVITLTTALHPLKLLSQYPEALPVLLLSQPEYQFSVGPTHSLSCVICETGVIFVSKDIMKRIHWIQNAFAKCLGNVHSPFSQFQLRYLHTKIIKKKMVTEVH